MIFGLTRRVISVDLLLLDLIPGRQRLDFSESKNAVIVLKVSFNVSILLTWIEVFQKLPFDIVTLANIEHTHIVFVGDCKIVNTPIRRSVLLNIVIRVQIPL